MESGIEKIKEKIEILDAVPADAEGITNVLHKAWLATYPNEELGITTGDIEEFFKDSFTEEKIKGLQGRLADSLENMKRVVAKRNGVVVGVATMIRNEENNQLQIMYVLPEFHGKGIGTELWQEVKKFAESGKDIILHTAAYNHNAIEFYEKLGFVATGKRWSDERWRLKSGAIIPEIEMVIKGSQNS